ncbi:MAG: hypothetical protein QG636_748 [Patescibacteria group bacterium]|nr:hypothetical protein [Patescibacteria group bacterium]
MDIRSRTLVIICVPLIILVVVASYYRFFISKDYIVDYKATCDPANENCFVLCEEEGCEEPEPYARISKYAADLYAQCGEDITDCESANACVPSDRHCVIEYCSEDKLDEGESCVDKITEDIEQE